MKTKEFIQALRKVIREEVRAAVKEEVRSLLYETKTQTNSISQVKHTAAKQPIKKNPIQYNTGNPMLDEVLAETIVPKGFGGGEGPMVTDYGDFGFTSNDVMASQFNTMMTEEDLPEVSSYGDPTMAFVKDYSAILKKADQISGTR